MTLSKQQITTLLDLVSTVESDETDCDGCLGEIAEFAELHLAAQEVPDAMLAVQNHLEQCVCCKDEFNALLKALEAIQS